VYEPTDDEYICPAGERLIWRYTSVDAGLRKHRYWSSLCPKCPIKDKCTPSDYRRVSRWKHEKELELMQARLDQAPESMRVRRRTVEHPFGTLKAWMGATHFLTKGLERVRTEMSLHVLAYNLKRVMNLMGNEALMAAMRA
jgi:transposase